MRFQSTLRRTERPISAALSPIPVNFNPRSDERSDDHRQASNLHIHRISIHAPTNGATLRICPRTLYIQISIHAPTNGATIVLHALLSVPPFQSTLRRTERRGLTCHRRLCKRISIHAPTNGATCVASCPSIVFNISIHAPTNGATSLLSESARSDTISIHAPTNGATRKNELLKVKMVFQSTLRRTERPCHRYVNIG